MEKSTTEQKEKLNCDALVTEVSDDPKIACEMVWPFRLDLNQSKGLDLFNIPH